MQLRSLKINTSYKQIVTIALPIMLGSAGQQIITLSDSIFLYHYDKLDFAAIGLISVFYLLLVSIAYGFSKGGQIMIARRGGEGNKSLISHNFFNLLYFELFMAILAFLFMYYGTEYVLKWFIESPVIYEKSLEYIKMRAFGVPFSFAGVAVIAFLTGIARNKFIIYDSILFILVNIILNYLLIFGKLGFPEMGIAGAGLASALSELAAVIGFIFYFFSKKRYVHWGMNFIPRIHFPTIRQIFNVSNPIVSQSVVGMGGWFLFFSFVEKYLGEYDLAIANLVRTVYMLLLIPSWGYSSGINTMVSHFIGRRKRMAVIPIIQKTALVNFVSTMIFAVPVLVFPSFFLYPLFWGEGMTMVNDTKPSFLVLLMILSIYSVSIVYFNGLVGAGAMIKGLWIQFVGNVFYVGSVFVMLKYLNGNVEMAWAAEIILWAVILGMSIYYLNSKKWHLLKL